MQVSGPAAGLTVIVYELIREQGLEAFAVIVIAAGFIQILWSWLQLGQWFRAVSPAVIHGMLAGIGALIFASQFHIMIDDLPKGSGLENILSLPSAVWKGLIDDDSTPMNHHLAARIGVLTIGTMVLWNVVLPKRFHVMPAVLLGVATATAVSALLDIPIQRIEVQDNLLSIVHFPTTRCCLIFSIRRFSRRRSGSPSSRAWKRFSPPRRSISCIPARGPATTGNCWHRGWET